MFVDEGTISANSLTITGGSSSAYNVILDPASAQNLEFTNNIFGNTGVGGPNNTMLYGATAFYEGGSNVVSASGNALNFGTNQSLGNP